jgi:hypothetical protein
MGKAGERLLRMAHISSLSSRSARSNWFCCYFRLTQKGQSADEAEMPDCFDSSERILFHRILTINRKLAMSAKGIRDSGIKKPGAMLLARL